MRWVFAMAALGILLTGQAFAQEAPEPVATYVPPPAVRDIHEQCMSGNAALVMTMTDETTKVLILSVPCFE